MQQQFNEDYITMMKIEATALEQNSQVLICFNWELVTILSKRYTAPTFSN